MGDKKESVFEMCCPKERNCFCFVNEAGEKASSRIYDLSSQKGKCNSFLSGESNRKCKHKDNFCG